jgi:hypothetical protein
MGLRGVRSEASLVMTTTARIRRGRIRNYSLLGGFVRIFEWVWGAVKSAYGAWH